MCSLGGADSIVSSRGGSCLVPKDCQPVNSYMLVSDCNQFFKKSDFCLIIRNRPKPFQCVAEKRQ